MLTLKTKLTEAVESGMPQTLKLPPRSKDNDLAALDLIDQVSQNLKTILNFKIRFAEPDLVSVASHPTEENVEYTIRRRPGNMHASTVTLDAPEGSEIALLYRGRSAAHAILWCKLHASWGFTQQAITIRGASSNNLSSTDPKTYYIREDETDGCWRLFSSDLTDLGTWSSHLQARLVAQIHKAYT